jgi:hypothetical protein
MGASIHRTIEGRRGFFDLPFSYFPLSVACSGCSPKKSDAAVVVRRISMTA